MMSMDSLSLKSLEQQFEELCSIINYHRGRASQAVNEQQLLTAWNVGAYVSQKLKTNEWGSKVVTLFVEYMRTHVPEQKGFGRANIYNMVMLYEEYSSPVFLSLIGKYVPSVIVQSKIGRLESVDSTTASDALKTAQSATPQIVQFPIGQMPDILLYTSYTNHIAILNQCKTAEQRLFYILYAHRERLKVKELQRCISNDTYSSLLGSKHNLSKGLLDAYSNAPVLFKDTAFIDFLGLPQKYSEKKLRMGLAV